jgi:hypothetical protein
MVAEVRGLLGCLALSLSLGAACSGDTAPAEGAGNGGTSAGSGSAGSGGGASVGGGGGLVGGGGCAPGGCSSELCGEEGEGLISDCAYREEFDCYRSARCERQSSGRCGWTQTDELRQCIEQAGNTRPY